MNNVIVFKGSRHNNNTAVGLVMSLWFDNADGRQLVVTTKMGQVSSYPFGYVSTPHNDDYFCYSLDGFIST